MNTFKFKIENNDTEFKGISVSNQKISCGLFNELNKACHTAIDQFNGKLGWFDTFVKFEHDGKLYTQVKSKQPCSWCAFLQHNNVVCVHPHFTTKPNCNGKIYIVEHVFNENINSNINEINFKFINSDRQREIIEKLIPGTFGDKL